MTRFVRMAFGLALALMMVVGCQSGSTKGGTRYSMLPSRELQARFPAELASVHDRAVAVLRDNYGFNVTREARDAMEGVVEATTARNDKVTIQTYREGANLTTVQIWFGDGPFGNANKAQQVLEELEQDLGITATVNVNDEGVK